MKKQLFCVVYAGEGHEDYKTKAAAIKEAVRLIKTGEDKSDSYVCEVVAIVKESNTPIVEVLK